MELINCMMIEQSFVNATVQVSNFFLSMNNQRFLCLQALMMVKGLNHAYTTLGVPYQSFNKVSSNKISQYYYGIQLRSVTPLRKNKKQKTKTLWKTVQSMHEGKCNY